MVLRVGNVIAAVAAVLLTTSIAPAAAEDAECRTGFGNITSIFAPGADAPAIQPAKRKLKRDAPAAWSKAVAAKCSSADPSWARAKKRKISCGHFNSLPRFTCSATAIPAPRRR